MSKIRRWTKRGLIGFGLLLLAIQAVPYGRAHTNPAVTAEPTWDSPRTRQLAQRACFDCHSNETRWPWYTQIAPFSWLVQYDVDEGREHLNFSEWDQSQDHGGDAAEEFAEGEMPPKPYLLLHSEARLKGEEREALRRGLAKTLGEEHGDDRENE